MKKKQGFTLIELVVVIAILGILAGLAIPRYLNSQASAKGAKLLGDLRTIDSAIALYNTRTGSYPANIAVLTSEGGASDDAALLASVPIPPSGEMRVRKNDGTEAIYEHSAEAYSIDQATGRATYVCTTGTGDVDWYLGNTGNSGSGTGTGGGTGSGNGVLTGAITNNWEQLLAANLINGFNLDTVAALYSDASGDLYIGRYGQYVNATQAQAGITLAQYAASEPNAMVKIDTSTIVDASTALVNNIWSAPLSFGTLVKNGNEYYISVKEVGVYETNFDDGGAFLKVNF